jgi:SAM-dependent methyltransferase
MTPTCDEYLLDWSDYHDFLHTEFLDDLDNKHIVEIAPFTGAQTQIIYRSDFLSLTLIETNPDAVQHLVQTYPRARVIHEDIFEAYEKIDLTCDVVICLGLLYHLHSPLYLLENIVNRSQPRSIILDSVHCGFLGQGGLMAENINVPGNMYTKRKAVPRSVAFSYPDINTALTDLGYLQSKYHDLDQFDDVYQKKVSWMARWERNDLSH